MIDRIPVLVISKNSSKMFAMDVLYDSSFNLSTNIFTNQLTILYNKF